jgi:transcriptional regulator with XRE-family HTH domain
MGILNQRGGEAMSIGKQIRIARIQKGWQQQDLRRAADISQKHLSQIEHDRVEPGAFVLKRICVALGVSADAILEIPVIRP